MVHKQAYTFFINFNHYNHTVCDICLTILYMIPVAQSNNGITFTPNHNKFFSIGLGNHRFGFYIDKFFDHTGFDDKCIISDLHDNSIDDCQCQWNFHGHNTAFSGCTVNVQHTANCLNIGYNHIHSDTTSGQFRHLVICGKTG